MYVYAMTNRGNPNLSKVGYSSDPTRRVNELNEQGYGSAYMCQGWRVHRTLQIGSSAQRIETKLHKILKSRGTHISMGGRGKREKEQELDALFDKYDPQIKTVPTSIEANAALGHALLGAAKKKEEQRVESVDETKKLIQSDPQDNIVFNSSIPRISAQFFILIAIILMIIRADTTTTGGILSVTGLVLACICLVAYWVFKAIEYLNE